MPWVASPLSDWGRNDDTGFITLNTGEKNKLQIVYTVC